MEALANPLSAQTAESDQTGTGDNWPPSMNDCFQVLNLLAWNTASGRELSVTQKLNDSSQSAIVIAGNFCFLEWVVP